MKARAVTVTEPTLWVHLRAKDPNKKLKLILASLKEACTRLPSPYHDQISQDICSWEEDKYPTCKTTFRQGNALCYLCFNTVENVMFFIANTREDKALWLKARKELEGILKENHPPGCIETYKQRQSALLSLPEKIERIRALFQGFQDELYSVANEMHQSSIKAFEKCKNDFKEFEDDQKKSAGAGRVTIDSLTEQMTALFLEFRENLNEVQNLENTIQEQDTLSLQNLDNIEKLINRV
jgi:hypothetical protein